MLVDQSTVQEVFNLWYYYSKKVLQKILTTELKNIYRIEKSYLPV